MLRGGSEQRERTRLRSQPNPGYQWYGCNQMQGTIKASTITWPRHNGAEKPQKSALVSHKVALLTQKRSERSSSPDSTTRRNA